MLVQNRNRVEYSGKERSVTERLGGAVWVGRYGFGKGVGGIECEMLFICYSITLVLI